MKGNITEQKLRQGQTVFKVTAHGTKSWIELVRITGKPHMVSDIGMFVSYVQTYDWGEHADSFSLDDTNIWPHPNTYNNHRAFYSRKKAESYLAKCIREDIPSGPRRI